MNFFDTLQVKKKNPTGQKNAFDPFNTMNTSSNQNPFGNNQQTNPSSFPVSTGPSSEPSLINDNNVPSQAWSTGPSDTPSTEETTSTKPKKFDKFRKGNKTTTESAPVFISNVEQNEIDQTGFVPQYNPEQTETNSNHGSQTGFDSSFPHNSSGFDKQVPPQLILNL
jgi:hypothetical protein